jgi:hypothetical protein
MCDRPVDTGEREIPIRAIGAAALYLEDCKRRKVKPDARELADAVLGEREITPAMVEAAARAICEDDADREAGTDGELERWDEFEDHAAILDEYRSNARAALKAALGDSEQREELDDLEVMERAFLDFAGLDEPDALFHEFSAGWLANNKRYSDQRDNDKRMCDILEAERDNRDAELTEVKKRLEICAEDRKFKHRQAMAQASRADRAVDQLRESEASLQRAREALMEIRTCDIDDVRAVAEMALAPLPPEVEEEVREEVRRFEPDLRMLADNDRTSGGQSDEC